MKLFTEDEVIHMVARIIGKTDLLNFQNFTHVLSSKSFDIEKYVAEKYPISNGAYILTKKLIEIGKSKSDI